MELTRTRDLLTEVLWRDSSPSTNVELRELARAGGAVPGSGAAGAAGRGRGAAGVGAGGGAGSPILHGTLLVTANQTAGRGRLDRGWVTPPDTALAASLLVRGFGQGELGMSWLPLIAGSAMVAALQPLFVAGAGLGSGSGLGAGDGDALGDSGGEAKRVGVKWPNDVHVRDEEDAIAGRPGKKLCGILCELLPDGAVIIGTGINLLIPDWELPTERATSLLAAGADVGGAESLADAAGEDLADRVLAAYAAELLRLVRLADTDPDAVRARVARHSLTLGTEVRVHLPGGEIVDGRARALAEDGSLIVDLPTGGELVVSAGDVEHLR